MDSAPRTRCHADAVGVGAIWTSVSVKREKGDLWCWSGVGSGEEEETVLEGKYFRSKWGREYEIYHLLQ